MKTVSLLPSLLPRTLVQITETRVDYIMKSFRRHTWNHLLSPRWIKREKGNQIKPFSQAAV